MMTRKPFSPSAVAAMEANNGLGKAYISRHVSRVALDRTVQSLETTNEELCKHARARNDRRLTAMYEAVRVDLELFRFSLVCARAVDEISALPVEEGGGGSGRTVLSSLVAFRVIAPDHPLLLERLSLDELAAALARHHGTSFDIDDTLLGEIPFVGRLFALANRTSEADDDDDDDEELGDDQDNKMLGPREPQDYEVFWRAVVRWFASKFDVPSPLDQGAR